MAIYVNVDSCALKGLLLLSSALWEIAISECIQCMQDKCLCKPRPLGEALEKLDIPDQLFQQTSESWTNPCACCTGAEFSRLKFPKKNSFLNEQCDCRRNPKLIIRAFLETIRTIKTFGTTKTIIIIKNMRKVDIISKNQ